MADDDDLSDDQLHQLLQDAADRMKNAQSSSILQSNSPFQSSLSG